MHQAIIGGSPDLALAVRRFGYAGACRVHLGAGTFARDGAAGGSLARDVVEAEIWRNLLPAHPFIPGPEDVIAACIENIAVVRREHDGEGPRKAISHVARRDAGQFLRPDVYQLDLAGPVVVALQRSGTARAGTDGAAINDVGIVGCTAMKPLSPVPG